MSKDSTDARFGEIPTKKILGFSLQAPMAALLFIMWGNLQFYATSVLFIPPIVVTLIFLVYSLVDAFNDPLIGYFTDRSKKFTARFGKRFLWIAVGGSIGPYESFLTFLEVNHASLYPDLFRDDSSRRKAVAIGAMIGGLVTIIFSVISPIMLGIFGGALSQPAYLIRTVIFVFLAYLLFIPYLRSVRESKERKKFRAELDQAGKSSSPFMEVLKNLFKDKIWVGLIFSYLLWATAGACMLYGMNYFLIYYLDLPIEAGALPSLGYALCTIIFTPIWTTLAKKIGIRKTYLITLTLHTFIYVFFFFFVNSFPGLIIVTSLAGIPAAANFGVIAILARAAAIDNTTVKTNRREEGSFLGIFRVFTAFTYFFQVSIFTLVGTITGFNATIIPSIDPVVKQGLNLQMSLIPMVLNILAILIIYFTYKITEEQAQTNKTRLEELNL